MRQASRLLQPLRACLSSVWKHVEPGCLSQSQRVLGHGNSQACFRRLSALQPTFSAGVFTRQVSSTAHKDTEVDEINRMFAECRDEIEMTREVGSHEQQVHVLWMHTFRFSH